jgi:hypothetical protein
LDTVLGLSVAPGAAGWVLVADRDDDDTVVDHDEFEVHTEGGMRAMCTSERVTAAVLRVQEATARDHRLNLVGLTWSDDAAAEAAVLVESLTDAGFENIVAIRFLHAAEMLARDIAPLVGYDKVAVCIVDGETAVVVTVDAGDDGEQTAVERLTDGADRADRLGQRLSTMFDRSAWSAGAVVVVGSDHDLDGLSRQLETALQVPVFTQNGTQFALARGAALASVHGAQFAGAAPVDSRSKMSDGRERPRSRSYVAAVSMLVAGAISFAASVSLVMGPRLLPEKAPGQIEQAIHKSAPVARPPAWLPTTAKAQPAQAAPEPAPTAQAAPEPAPPEDLPTAAPPEDLPTAAPPEEPPSVVSAESSDDVPADESPPPNPHPLLAKLLERLQGGPAPEEPAPAQDAPPNSP